MQSTSLRLDLLGAPADVVAHSPSSAGHRCGKLLKVVTSAKLAAIPLLPHVRVPRRHLRDHGVGVLEKTSESSTRRLIFDPLQMVRHREALREASPSASSLAADGGDVLIGRGPCCWAFVRILLA
eukprot:997990-Pyramimonas_sp.AAC.2